MRACQQLHRILDELDRLVDQMNEDERTELRRELQPILDEALVYCAKRGIFFLDLNGGRN